MKLNRQAIANFIKSPSKEVYAALVYGEDLGQVYEVAHHITMAVTQNKNDPFLIFELNEETLKDDPALLFDEAAQISMVPGRRVIKLHSQGDKAVASFKAFLGDPVGDALVLVTAPSLGPRSKWRVLFEKSTNAVTIPCYLDGARTIQTLVQKELKQHKITIEPQALNLFVLQQGIDRQITRNEIEKLVLYAGDNGQITSKDIDLLTGDGSKIAIDTVVMSSLSGNLLALDKAYAQALKIGSSPIAILRISQSHIQKLMTICKAVESGKSINNAIKSLRPPVFFKTVPQLESQARLWSWAKLERVFFLLLKTEAACKTTNTPADIITLRALQAMAFLANRRPPKV